MSKSAQKMLCSTITPVMGLLPVLTKDIDSTAWFGRIDNVESHICAGSTANLTANPSTAGPVKRKASTTARPLKKKQMSDSKGKKVS
jgi:hypothetical protein